MTELSQLAYNDIYVDTVFPFVKSLNEMGFPTNPNPVSV